MCYMCHTSLRFRRPSGKGLLIAGRGDPDAEGFDGGPGGYMRILYLPPELGYFLARTWRMHPALADVVSRLSYEDRLRAMPHTAERSLEEVEEYVHDFAVDNPHVNISLLRFCKVLGDELETPISRALQLPLVPKIAGFDPRMQFVHETDVVAAIVGAVLIEVVREARSFSDEHFRS